MSAAPPSTLPCSSTAIPSVKLQVHFLLHHVLRQRVGKSSLFDQIQPNSGQHGPSHQSVPRHFGTRRNELPQPMGLPFTHESSQFRQPIPVQPRRNRPLCFVPLSTVCFGKPVQQLVPLPLRHWTDRMNVFQPARKHHRAAEIQLFTKHNLMVGG